MMLCRHKDVYEVYIVNKENATFILEKMHKNYGKAGENPYIVLDNHYKYRYTNIFPISCAYGYWDDENNTLNFGSYRYNNVNQFQLFDNNQQNLLEKDIYSKQKVGNYFIIGDYSSRYHDGNYFCTPEEFQEEYELVFDTFNNNKRKD